MDELLALLGQNWRLLLLYPSGLTIVAATTIIGFVFHGRNWWRSIRFSTSADMVIAAGWLSIIALLPLPQTGWPYGLDVLTVLLLVEVPYSAKVIRRRSETTVTTVAALLNSYPLIALAIAALGQGAGSLVIREINRSTDLLHWVGIVAWALTLPPLIGIGPWRSLDRPHLLQLLRQTTHIGLLLALTLPAHDATPQLNSVIGFILIALPLALIQHRWRGTSSRWIHWQLWLVMSVALLIAALSGQQLLGRLR